MSTRGERVCICSLASISASQLCLPPRIRCTARPTNGFNGQMSSITFDTFAAAVYRCTERCTGGREDGNYQFCTNDGGSCSDPGCLGNCMKWVAPPKVCNYTSPECSHNEIYLRSHRCTVVIHEGESCASDPGPPFTYGLADDLIGRSYSQCSGIEFLPSNTRIVITSTAMHALTSIRPSLSMCSQPLLALACPRHGGVQPTPTISHLGVQLAPCSPE